MLEGDLVLEATYDEGKSGWEQNKPQVLGVLRAVLQGRPGHRRDDTRTRRTARPSAFGQGPFTGLTPFPADDAKLGSSSQGIAMVMARYQMDPNWEISGGLRANRWSGAYAVITTPPNTKPAPAVDAVEQHVQRRLGPGTSAACPCQGYAATLGRPLLGLRYRTGPLDRPTPA